MQPTIVLEDPELTLLKRNKESGFNYRQRRQDEWTENYTMYRDRVQYNRLTQRQSVNIPLMKQTIKTLLKDVDDMPVLYFENLDNDKEAETFQNEYWKWTIDHNKMELKDIVDKKQDMFFGRSFDQMQIVDGCIKITIEDPEDILVDRYCDPTDLDSARYLIHTHIFVPLAKLELNPNYNKKAVNRLKTFYASEAGLIKSRENYEMLQKKNEKMSDLGVEDVEAPILGETYVELSLHFIMRKEPTETEEQYYLYVEADDMEILMKETLEKTIGKPTKDNYWRTHLPYNSWADDIDRQDFWTDGVADIVRVPNKVLNSWFSQLVENRTLRNYGMHYYDSTKEGFAPQTFTPVPWGWYGLPGKPEEIMSKVDIPDLSESIDEMNYITQMIEKASGATSTLQGTQTERQITLGEVQLALGEAKERVKGMSKFYTQVWKERGEKFLKLIEAGADKLDAVTIYKKGRNSDDLYPRAIAPEDWMTEAGYGVKVWSQDEKKAQDTTSLERVSAAVANIPGNQKLVDIYQRKLLEFADLKPDEINEVIMQEQQKREAMMNPMNQMGMGQPQMGQPINPIPNAQMPMYPAPPPPAPAKTQPKKSVNKEVVGKLNNIKNRLSMAANG